MHSGDMDAVVKNLFCEVFGISDDEINDETRRGDLERWDSLGHLDLIEAIRNKFQIEITPELALDMETVADVKRVVADVLTDQGVQSDENLA